MATDRLIRMADVVQITTLSRSTIYRQMDLADFPSPVLLGERSPRWRESEVQQWIAERQK